MPETTVILVRHGESVWNREGRVQGESDVELNERGLEQASLVAERLADIPLKAVYSSDLGRAVRTAETIAQRHNLAVTRLKELREMNYGHWQGLTSEEIRTQHAEEFAQFRQDGLHTRIQDGETALEMRQRVLASFADILARHPGETVAVVSHTGPLKIILAEAVEMDPAKRWHLALDNASVSVVRYTEKGGLLVLLNDTLHLRPLKKEDQAPGSDPG